MIIDGTNSTHYRWLRSQSQQNFTTIFIAQESHSEQFLSIQHSIRLFRADNIPTDQYHPFGHPRLPQIV